MNTAMHRDGDPETDELDREIGSNIAAWLRKKGVTSKDAAGWIGVHPSKFSDRLHGRTAFKAHEVKVIADRLNVPVEHFYGDFTLRTELMVVTDDYALPTQNPLPFGPPPALAIVTVP